MVSPAAVMRWPGAWQGAWTRREFRERMEAGDLVGCIVPVAATEQHLEHLAMEHDWRSVCHVAELVAARHTPGVLVAPGLMVGISEHHMRHPGSVTLAPGTFLAALADLIDSQVRAGFRNVLVLNGHGGNVAPCQGVWDQFQRKFPVNLHFMSYWDVLTAEDARQWLRSGERLPEDLPGHAQEFETAIALAAFPENVRPDAVADQRDSTPALARAEAGRAFLDRVVERVSDYLGEMLNGTRTNATPPFHP